MSDLSHFDTQGNAIMVDVTQKSETVREAVATGSIKVCTEIMNKIQNSEMEKGDVLGVARIAGIQAAKRTWELIPLCHILPLTSCRVEFECKPKDCVIQVFCRVKTQGKTGVEMEALTGVQIALLTIYDMCKAVDKSMIISDVHLVKKSGGKSGDYYYSEIGDTDGQ